MMAAHASVTMPSMNHEDSSTGFEVEQESNILDSSIQLCKGKRLHCRGHPKRNEKCRTTGTVRYLRFDFRRMAYAKKKKIVEKRVATLRPKGRDVEYRGFCRFCDAFVEVHSMFEGALVFCLTLDTPG